MMAVPITTEPTLSLGNPVALFSGSHLVGGGNIPPPFDIAPDCQRFLMLKDAPGASDQEIIVVQNWVEELTHLVPVP